MKFYAVLALCLGAARATLLLNIPSLKTPMVFKRNVGDNQICKGRFCLETPSDGQINISIFTEDFKRVFHKEGLKSKENVDFSFNTMRRQACTVRIEEKEQIKTPIKVLYEFTSQYNTFNEDVAKSEIIDPAMVEMSRFEKLLYELSQQTSFRQKETAAFSDSIKEIVVTILVINFVMFIAFTGILTYQMFSFKVFLKKKKLI